MRFVVILLLAMASNVFAVGRCDCTSQLADCVAQISSSDKWLEITTNTKQCAEVIFYTDGYPNAALVTDGREVVAASMKGVLEVAVGQCRVCEMADVSANQRLETALTCSEDLLMPTAETSQCIEECSVVPSGKDRKQCQRSCQQHSRCLDKNCVETLRRKLQSCEKSCDRAMHSSMVTDIDDFRVCMGHCNKIKKQIGSCPIL